MYEKLTKNALKCMYIATGITMFILICIFMVVGFIFNDIKVLFIVMCMLSAAALLDAIISPIVRFNRYRYKIDDECIDIEEGYIFVSRDIVPIERIHKLNISRGPIDRLCKVAKIVVTTAGGDVTIRFLDEERAGIITEGLMKRINDIVQEEKEEALDNEKQLEVDLEAVNSTGSDEKIGE